MKARALLITLLLGVSSAHATPSPIQDAWTPDPELLKKEGGLGTTKAVRSAIDWLLAHQAADGRFGCADFVKRCVDHGGETCKGTGNVAHDAGTTGLAILVLTGTGSTLERGEFQVPIRRAVTWLLSMQKKEGFIGRTDWRDFLYSHIIATYALCEALYEVDAPKLRAQTQRALDAIEAARNPFSGWRYDALPTGENDTGMTTWALSALFAGAHSDFDVAPEALLGGLDWIDSVTRDGHTGYDQLGSASARTPSNKDYDCDLGEAMTGAGLWARLLVGRSPESEGMPAAADRILKIPPMWKEHTFANDMYYWHYGTLAMFQVGGKHWKKWNAALKETALEWQQALGGTTGSWDPVGPWGYTGGRVYSTALMALSLQVYYRYPRFNLEGDSGLGRAMREKLNAKPRILTLSPLVVGKREVRIESYPFNKPGSKKLELRYTLNGKHPGPGAKAYKKPILVKGGNTLVVQAYLDGIAVGEPGEMAFQKVKPLRASKTRSPKPGLLLARYEDTWASGNKPPDLSRAKPKFETTVEKLERFEVREESVYRWTGLIHIATSEIYHFSAYYREGLRLSVSGQDVLWPPAEDEQHAPELGQVALSKGWHEFQLDWMSHTNQGFRRLTYGLLGGEEHAPSKDQLGHSR